MKIRHLLFLLPAALAAALFPASVFPQRLEGQTVTYADFSYINYVASSMTHVYFATTQGITRYNKAEQRWDDPMTGQPGLVEKNIRRVWVDTFDEDLYADAFDGLFEYNKLFESWEPALDLPDISSNSKSVSPPETLFPPFGYTYFAGGTLIDPNGRAFSITDMIEDEAGTLWLGTWGHGAATASALSDPIHFLPFGLIQNHVNAVYYADSLMWLGGYTDSSYRAGLTIFNVKRNSFSYVEEGIRNDFPFVDVYCLEGDSEAVYIGTGNGLMVYDRQEDRISDHMDTRSGLTDNEVLSMKLVGDSLFVGTAGGLVLLDFAADSVRYINLKEFFNQSIYSMATQDTFLWIGAANGAYRYTLTSGKLQQYQDPKAVLFSQVYAVQVYGDEVWFVGNDAVLMLDTKTGETQDYQIINSPFWPRALAVNGDIAAVSSQRGMTLIFRDRYKPLMREFTTDDGLASGDVYTLTLDGDYLWIGTDQGLTRFLWNNPRRVD